MPTFKNILCPVDFSTTSRDALTTAVELARTSKAALTIVHVWQPPLYGAPEATISGDVIQTMVDDAERMLAECVATAKSSGVPTVHSQLLTGVPWAEIVKPPGDGPAYDLIVIGTHGRTGLKHVLIGSVAERVVRHASCAVLVVR
jgi:glycine betaine transporter